MNKGIPHIEPRGTQYSRQTHRVFYVDAAKSIKSNEGVRYWKSALVEDDKCLTEFANSKVQGANGAEAYAILGSLYGMLDNKIFESEKKIVIGSDNMIVVKNLKGENLEALLKKYPNRNDKIKSHFYKYTYLIQKLIKEHNLKSKIKFFWVKGIDNPADYYSRDAYKRGNPSRQGKLLVSGIQQQ